MTIGVYTSPPAELAVQAFIFINIDIYNLDIFFINTDTMETLPVLISAAVCSIVVPAEYLVLFDLQQFLAYFAGFILIVLLKIYKLCFG